jgi:hypothetical protein
MSLSNCIVSDRINFWVIPGGVEMSHCRVCGVLEDVGDCVVCEDCADKQQTVKELIERLEKYGFRISLERIKK